MGIVRRLLRPSGENQEAGPSVWLPHAVPGEEDQTAAKRVESSRIPCLDAGSTPASSTRAAMRRRIAAFFFCRLACFLLPSVFGCVLCPVFQWNRSALKRAQKSAREKDPRWRYRRGLLIKKIGDEIAKEAADKKNRSARSLRPAVLSVTVEHVP